MQRRLNTFSLDRTNAAKYQHISMLGEFWKRHALHRLDTLIHLEVREWIHASPEPHVFPWCSTPSVFVPNDDRMIFAHLQKGNLCPRCLALCASSLSLTADPHYVINWSR